ncbi:hypothetical protein C9I56_33260 [Paraburkholderia caribensis]|nr:hypothetical protein C9I56_33260 [Paraburkholderia caribensis]
MDERLFKIAFGILVLQVKELQDIRILDRFFRSYRVTGFRDGALLEHGALIFGHQCVRAELAANLTFELSHAPAAAQRFRFVERPLFGRTRPPHQPHVMRPRQREALCELLERKIPNQRFGICPGRPGPGFPNH